ncbi:MAG TPA: hypothetical protein VFR47_11600 [Anaerolineales bacterium]|nr:hypothetical protein [Anaerolineales bacterium]
MGNKMTKYGFAILIALIFCVSLPVVWLEVYIWQYCLFPPNSPNVEVVVSACDNPTIKMMSPDGRYLPYSVVTSKGYESWVLDTVTGERQLDTTCGNWWLNNTLKLGGITKTAKYPGEFTICDITDGTKIAVEWSEDTIEVPEEVVERFRDAEQVYYISFSRWAIALGPDFKNHPEQVYVLAEGYDPTHSVLNFLKDNQISYQEINYPNEGKRRVSHNGRFVTKLFGEDGFYTAEGTKIGPLYDNFSRDYPGCCTTYGWAYDDSGVYAQAHIQSGGMFPNPTPRQPILKLDLPQEYLTPAARQALNVYQNHARVEMMIKVLVLILLLLAGLWFFWWRRKVKRETVK